MTIEIKNIDKVDIKSNKFKTIYIDPPWPEYGGGKIKRGADKHYPLMSLKEIKALDIDGIADERCHLYLWVTNNFLEEGLECVKGWGFKYITLITWMKDRIGLGQYYRGITEHCIFARKEVLPYKIIDGKRAQGQTGFIVNRVKHSEKPEIMIEMIEKVSYPPYIELFAREKRNGWTSIGFDIDGLDIEESLKRLI